MVHSEAHSKEFITKNLGENKEWPQYLTVLTALILVFTTALQFAWPSPSLPQLLSDNNNYTFHITADDASYIVTVSSFGNIIGDILSSLIVDVIGRKWTLLSAAPLFIISMLLIHFATAAVVFLYVARIIGGVAEGICITVMPIYVGEVSESKIRGILGSLFTVFWFGGVLVMNIVGSRYSIGTTSLITMSFPIIFFVLFCTMPESPYYLLMKNKVDQAQNSLRKLRHVEVVNEELEQIEKDVCRQMSERGQLQDLFLIKSNRKALITVCTLTTVQMFSGVATLTFYAQIFFSKATNVISEDWAAVLVILIKLVFAFVTVALVDITGRKLLLLISTMGCSVSLVFLSVYFFVKDYSVFKIATLDWIPLLGMVLFTVFYVIGMGPIVTCLLGELFSASVKAKAVCITNIILAITTFCSTKLYQTLADNYSIGFPLLIFAACQILGFVFCFRFLAETKGKTLEEIQETLKISKTTSDT